MKWASARRVIPTYEPTHSLTILQTLQAIAFSAHLREVRFPQPFLVVCPLSVLHNWADEYRKFAPDVSSIISVILHIVSTLLRSQYAFIMDLPKKELFFAETFCAPILSLPHRRTEMMNLKSRSKLIQEEVEVEAREEDARAFVDLLPREAMLGMTKMS